MARIERSDVVLVLLALAGIAVILLVLFRYYTYRDYARAPCEVQDLPLTVSTATEWDEGLLRSVRGEPYMPRLSMAPMPDGMSSTAFVRDVALRSTKTGVPLALGDAATRLAAFPLQDGRVVFRLDGLRMPYEDYRVSGELVFPGDEGERRFPFVCPLRATPSSEWRFTPLDMLMSV
jgi:hypothetical protein